ncbi:MAG: hypothetical protein N2595_03720 [bacterium]|nr:hypothetical protein [bacterium]
MLHAPIRLSGIPPLKFGIGEDNTFVGAAQRMLTAMGRPIPYFHLMGLSGAAFRIQIHCNGWRINSPDLMCGYDLTYSLASAVGVQLERIWLCCNQHKIEYARQRAFEALQRGWPSIGLGMDGKSHHGIIIGGSPDSLIALDYSFPSASHEVLEKLVWCYHVPVALFDPPPRHLQLRTAFQLALTLMSQPRANSFHLGLDAYDYWRATLTNPDHHNAQRDDWRTRERNDGNYWILVSLIDARRSAAAFCHALADEIPHCRSPLLHLHHLYSTMVDTLEPLLSRQTVRPARLISPAWPWTMHDRRKQALLLEHVQGYERRALALIESLITAL